MKCYDGECGLINDYSDSASMVMNKHKKFNDIYPTVDTNINKFKTIIR